jgi:hypothetical protein
VEATNLQEKKVDTKQTSKQICDVFADEELMFWKIGG